MLGKKNLEIPELSLAAEYVLDVYRQNYGDVVFEEEKYEQVFKTKKSITVADMSRYELLNIALLDLFARESVRNETKSNRAARRKK